VSIQATNIRKTFGAYTALDGVDLHVPTGKLVSLLGPSGSGKTTLLRILAGLEFPDPEAGSKVFFHGEDVTATPAGKRGVGFVFQHYALFKHMTIADNIAFGLRARPRANRPSARAIRDRVRELLELVQLGELGRRFPSELSGGQRQRIALARALAVEPKVLLLDEPFGALDAQVRKDLRRWLRTFQEQIKVTTVFVTHDQEEALELADEVVVMNNARIEQVGSPQEVFDFPESPFVIEFMGNVNRVTAGLGNIKIASRDSLYVRPHDIEILATPGRTGVDARVLHIFSAGSVGRVSLARIGADEILEAEVPRSELRVLNLQPGQIVGVRFRHIRLFARNEKGRTELVERDLAEKIPSLDP
jgi:sulfate/thiosulfate transport system ATP-binding protein